MKNGEYVFVFVDSINDYAVCGNGLSSKEGCTTISHNHALPLNIIRLSYFVHNDII